jgi:prepilin-type N-terminal cleavage/methylation domain-containing protein
MASASGFTLIELMVVMVVIGILASLVLSVLNRGRESASAVKCLGHMNQIGQAILAYSADNEGRLPGPLTEQQNNDVSSVQDGSLMALMKRYLGIEGPDGRVMQAGVFTCPAWELKDKSRRSAVFVMNFQDRMPDLQNRLPWGEPGVEPVKMVNLVGWNPRPAAQAAMGLSQIWALRDGDFAPEAGRSVHGDFRNALFYDLHAGRVDLKNEPK